MDVPPRLAPFLLQYDDAAHRLIGRLRGPTVDSGDGEDVAVPPLTDDEYLWAPAPGAWSVRRHADGPGPGATVLVGAGEWGRDGGRPHPYPPPVTTIAWRMHHLSEMLLGRADWTVGDRQLSEEAMVVAGAAAAGIATLESALAAWRAALIGADDAALDTVGHSAYPWGSDPEEPFLTIVAWVNQEVLHHGAEIALLRDLYRVAADRKAVAAKRPALRAIVVDTTDARALGEFYRELLGYGYRPGDEPPAPGEPDPRGTDWLVLRDADGEARLAIQQVDELPASTWPAADVPQQLHLDITVGGTEQLRRERDRALALGATVLLDRSDDPAEELYVFADPAGHPFCIFVSPDHPG